MRPPRATGRPFFPFYWTLQAYNSGSPGIQNCDAVLRWIGAEDRLPILNLIHEGTEWIFLNVISPVAIFFVPALHSLPQRCLQVQPVEFIRCWRPIPAHRRWTPRERSLRGSVSSSISDGSSCRDTEAIPGATSGLAWVRETSPRRVSSNLLWRNLTTRNGGRWICRTTGPSSCRHQ